MNIKHLVIHEIKKEIATDSTINLSDTEINIDNTANEFVSQIRTIYNKRTGRYNGVFDSDAKNYPFQNSLKEFMESEISFLNLTNLSMNILKRNIDKENLATGGYIIFCQYEQSENPYFMVLMLHDKKSYVVDHNLKLKDSFQLSLEDLSMAVRVNTKQWKNEKDSYLTFVRGKKRQDISRYFFDFIGCTSNTSSTVSTKTLINVLTDYLNEKEFSIDQKNKIRNSVYNFCDNSRRNNKQVSIKELSQLIFEEENVVEFFEKAISDEYKLDSTIEINRSALRTLRVFKTQWKDISLSFPNGTPLVEVDYDSKSVILKEVPAKKIDQIKKFIFNK